MNNQFSVLRQRMVEEQIASRGVRDSNVLQAMLTVERHRFVPQDLQQYAYSDQPLPIGRGQTISQPYIVALMSELLSVDSQDRVLEIGTGSGYQAAVLACLAGRVYSIEIVEHLGYQAADRLEILGYDNVTVKIGDGYKGWLEFAPFDRIMVTAAPPRVPVPLLDQLAVGGKMVIPVGDAFQELQVITRADTGYTVHKGIPVRFVPMVGEVEQIQENR